METTADTRFTIPRALKELWGLVTAKSITLVLFLSMTSYAFVSGIYYANAAIVAGLLGAIVLWLAYVIFMTIVLTFLGFLREWLLNDVDREIAWAQAYPGSTHSYRSGSESFTPCELWAFWAPFVLPFFLSSFMFFGGPIIGNLGGSAWVIGSQATGTAGMVLGIPFYSDIIRYNLDQSVEFVTTANTLDGVEVQATLSADFSLINHGDHHDARAHRELARYRITDEDIAIKVREYLEIRFGRVVSLRNLSELEPNLVVEFETGSNATDALSEMGLQWADMGVLRIMDIHVYHKSVGFHQLFPDNN